MAGKVLKVAGGLAVLVILGAGGGVLWAVSARNARLGATFTPHDVQLVFPIPLTEVELDELRAARQPEVAPPTSGEAVLPPQEPADPLASVDLEALALERAVLRGHHLATARYVCVECHGQDFGGGEMVDDPAMGTWLGPNLTLGKGSVTADYTASDWDHIVRHGVKRGGHPTIMPSEDFAGMSDQELSDIVVYIRSMPPVDRVSPAPSYGPVSTMLIATGMLALSAEHLDMDPVHAALPPPAEVSLEFGAHLARVCTGCHRADFSGGPILSGDPSWPPAANLTMHADGLAGWTLPQFLTLMQEGTLPDGQKVLEPMSLMTPYARNMTAVELEALWFYIQSLPAKPTGT